MNLLYKRNIVKSFSLLLSSIAIFSGCTNQTPNTPTNIILISLDTVRQDAVGPYSKASLVNTPNLNEFTQDSVLYTNAYAPMPFTPPSHMSMLTGMYPDVHRVHSTTKTAMDAGEQILPESISTLPQIFKNIGYETAGIYSIDWLKPGLGFERGFDRYKEIPHSTELAGNITKAGIDFITNRQQKDSPFFLFLHYYDAHSDFYEQHPPYAAPKAFRHSGYKEAAEKLCTPSGECATQFLVQSNINKTLLTKDELTLLRELYQGGINYLDSQIGTMLKVLKEKNLYHNSLIIITSDHGEEFQEHGSLLHEQAYEECSKIPLLIKFPKSSFATTEISVLVELIDLAPTILDFLNIQPPHQFQGKSLIPKKIKSYDDEKFQPLMQDKIKREIYAIRDRQYKLFYDTKTEKVSLHDLVNDPGETQDISGNHYKISQKLLASLKKKLMRNQKLKQIYPVANNTKTKSILKESERQRLKSLGYIQ